MLLLDLSRFGRKLSKTSIPNNNSRKQVAFTLAEVLITLGIIGVVAAMTMPTLIGKYRKAQTVTQLKKAYSELNQAIRISEATYGTLDSWDFQNFDGPEARAKYFGENYLFPNMKITKKCLGTTQNKECWSDNIKTINGIISDSYANGKMEGCLSFITSSGYSVMFWLHGNGIGGWFWVDLNGKKEPNTIGIDVFPFIMSWGSSKNVLAADGECLRKYGLFPFGLSCLESPSREDLINGNAPDKRSISDCQKDENRSYSGGYCGALIMYDGWEIKDDYPVKF